jgi:hypothetical protein
MLYINELRRTFSEGIGQGIPNFAIACQSIAGQAVRILT